jgi:hypothetical protein
MKIQTVSSGLSTVTLTNPSLTSYGSVSWPIANSAAQFSIQGSSGSFGTWDLVLPGDNPSSCWNGGSASSSCASSSYQFTSSIGGPSLLTAANNPGLWQQESGSLAGQNPYPFSSNFTSSAAPSTCTTGGMVISSSNVCVVKWYIYRYYFAVNLQTQGATLSVFCDPNASCQSPSSFFGFLSNYQQYKTAFQGGVTNALNTAINPAAYLVSPSRVSLQLNLPSLLGGQSNTDFAGILAAYTMPPCTQGAGLSVGDLCETGCQGAPGGYGICGIVQSNVHTSLNLYRDPAMTIGYSPSLGPQLNVQGYTAAQLAQVTPSSLLPTTYMGIDISQFGAQFQMNQACFVDAYTSCFAVSSPQVVLTGAFDVLTSTHTTYTTSYPTPPPQTGTNAGGMDGQVVDGSLFWHPGVPGATVCFTDIQGCSPVNSGGYFNATNVPAGTHSIQATAPGYYASPQITVQIGTGSTYHVGQISMLPNNPWYSGQLCLGILGQGPCISYVLLFSVIAAVVIIILGYGYFYSRAARTGSRIVSSAVR